MNVRNVKNLNVTLVINSGVNRSPTHDNVVRVYPSLADPQTLYPFFEGEYWLGDHCT